MAVNINVITFFSMYNEDEELRRRVAMAESMYPGSLELREAVVEEVLLPIAEEMGLPFTVDDLRAYETRVLMEDKKKEETGEEPDERVFWLLNHGWTNDESRFCGDD